MYGLINGVKGRKVMPNGPRLSRQTVTMSPALSSSSPGYMQTSVRGGRNSSVVQGVGVSCGITPTTEGSVGVSSAQLHGTN